MDLRSVIPILTGMRAPESEDEKLLAKNPGRVQAAMLRGRTWDKPIVSAVHGLCLTGGFEMVMGTLDRRRFASATEARMAVFEFIEGWYNPTRRHSSLGCLSPIQFEKNQNKPMRVSA
jgi:enoyl-CoA hydratase/carnithine racemase